MTFFLPNLSDNEENPKQSSKDADRQRLEDKNDVKRSTSEEEEEKSAEKPDHLLVRNDSFTKAIQEGNKVSI